MKNRIAELDVVRAVAAVAVVMIHVTAAPLVSYPVDSPSFLAYSLINQWSRFSIPAFVLLSGLALELAYGREKSVNWGRYFARRLRSVGVPYLIWCAVYVLFRTRVEGTWGQLPERYLRSVVDGTAMYHLYFIVLIFQFYLLYPLLRPLARSRWLGPATAVALVLNGFLMWDAYYGFLLDQAGPAWMQSVLRWRFQLFPWWAGYFMAGLWMASQRDHLVAWTRRWLWPLLGASCGLFGWMMVEYMGVMTRGAAVGFAASGFRPSAYLYSLAATASLIGLGNWLIVMCGLIGRAVLAFGRHSFGIYLVHPLLLEFAVRVLQPLGLPPAPYLVVISLGVLAGSYLFTWAVARFPFGRWIVGRA